ncbi:MAG: alpha/beta fold hydrolase [Myxococcota bacterium]
MTRGAHPEAGLRYDAEGFVPALDDTPLFWGERGAGESAVVLCDGLGCDGFAWHYLQPGLATDRRVLHWHYRGHGRSGSPREPERLTVGELARDLLGLLDARQVERAVLAGHSLGTQVILELYRIAPERVAGLLLVCGSSGQITRSFRGGAWLGDVLPGVRHGVRTHGEAVRALWGRLPSRVAYRLACWSGEVDAATMRPDDFRRYWDAVAHIAPETFFQLLASGGEHSAEDLLERVAVPTLVIAAERDTFTPPERARSLAERIPGAEYFEVRGGSHAALVEQPGAVLLRIEKFLAERVR